MSAPGPFTPKRRDAILAVLALALLSAPLWVSALHLDDTTYHYERAQVTTNDEWGLGYATDEVNSLQVHISDDIACSMPDRIRTCAFERYVAANHSVPTSYQAEDADSPFLRQGRERYQYALINGSGYETTYAVNRSDPRGNGNYGVELALEPVALTEMLEVASLDPDDEAVPEVVAEAAREGVGYSIHEVDVPETTIAVDGDYYRVYRSTRTNPLPIELLADWLLTWIAPIVGLVLVFKLTARIEVNYVGESP